MRILFIGDVVGLRGREMIEQHLSQLKTKWKPQLTIVNGENMAHGRGLTEKYYKSMLQMGVDVVTMGNHTWDNRDIFHFIDNAKRLVRPANFPEGTPGNGMVILNVNQLKVAIINLQGRTFMNPIDDPFSKADELVMEARRITPLIFVDFHAETTSEKQALALYLDGRVSAVCGTHTHVQTNDGRILEKGTAYLTDVGMTGPRDGVLGMDSKAVIQKFRTALPHRFEVIESGPAILSYAVIDIDNSTGKATQIKQFIIDDKTWVME